MVLPSNDQGVVMSEMAVDGEWEVYVWGWE